MNEKNTSIISISIVAVCAFVLIVYAFTPQRTIIVQPESQKVSQDTTPYFVIIGYRFDDSGMVILDFAHNGDPRTAYFPSGQKASEFVDYLKTVGRVEYLGIPE